MNAAIPASVLNPFEQPPAKVIPTAVWWTGGAMGLAIIGLLAALVLKTQAPAPVVTQSPVAVAAPSAPQSAATPGAAVALPQPAVEKVADKTQEPAKAAAPNTAKPVAAKPAAERTAAAAKPAPTPAVVQAPQTTPAPVVAQAGTAAGAPAGAPASPAAGSAGTSPAGAPVGTVYSGFPPVAQGGAAPAAQPAGSPAPAAEPRRATVNPNLGTVESVTPVQVAGGSGSPVNVGSVAGGVIGAVVGNQVGQGSGKTLATILGAAAGAYVGNEVNRRTATTTAYSVQVRMDDGSYRTVQTPVQPALGGRVLVEGGQLRQADGSPMAQPRAVERQPEPTSGG